MPGLRGKAIGSSRARRLTVAESTLPQSEAQVWIDAQLPPALARWLNAERSVHAVHVYELGMHQDTDWAIFSAARKASALVVTKDDDFVKLLGQHGPPPKVLWVRTGNVSNTELRRMMLNGWDRAARMFAQGEDLVEIRPKIDSGE